jgi:hypothetical protein
MPIRMQAEISIIIMTVLCLLLKFASMVILETDSVCVS